MLPLNLSRKSHARPGCRRRAAPGLLAAGTMLLGLVAAHATDPPAEKLPIKRVVLFTSGIGFFEHSGEIDGDAKVELKFNLSDVNDLLKSMVLRDFGGGRISTISYGSKDPIDKTLKTFAIDLTTSPTLADLLRQVRGEKVELKAPEKIVGSIIGVETRKQPIGKEDVFNVDYLNLLTERGLRSVPLKDVGMIRLINRSLDEELRQALGVLATAHSTDKKTVALDFRGKGKRPVRVGYTLQSPIWKTSYRLVLPGKEPAVLQGWAIVENTTEEDWKNVSLLLISGRPISFVMNLYDPLYVARPIVEPELFASIRPQMYRQDLFSDDRKPDAAPVDQTASLSVSPEGELEADRVIRREMDKLVTFHFQNTPLSEVISQVKAEANVNTILDLKGLQLANVDPSIPITLSVERLPLRNALRILLDPLELTYLVRNGALSITDAEQTGAKPVTRIYPVHDLAPPDIYEEVIEMIQITIDPDSWEANGGTGTIDYYASKGCLVVTQSARMHEEIEDLFRQLRRIRNIPGLSPAHGYVPRVHRGRGGGGIGGGGPRGGFGGLGGGGGLPVEHTPENAEVDAGPRDFVGLNAGVDSAAIAGNLGELFQYKIEAPVSLARQRSAMIPIVNQAVEVEKLSIYDQAVQAKHPLNGLRLKNTTDLHLMQGPVMVFDDGAYAGDARIEDLAPGGERLMSYAVDLDIEVAPEAKESPDELKSVKIVKGVLQASRKYRRERKYTVKNSGKEKTKLFVEYPIDAGWTLLKPEKPAEKTRDAYRFAVDAEPAKSTELVIAEESRQSQEVAVTNLDDKAIQVFLNSPAVNAKVKTALSDIFAKKSRIAQVSAQLQQARNKITAISEEQTRIRQNMTTLDKQDELFRRYVKKLSEQEDEVESLHRLVSKLSDETQTLQADLDKYLATLDVD